MQPAEEAKAQMPLDQLNIMQKSKKIPLRSQFEKETLNQSNRALIQEEPIGGEISNEVFQLSNNCHTPELRLNNDTYLGLFEDSKVLERNFVDAN